MIFRTISIALMSVAMLSGCTTTPKSTDAAPATARQLEELRAKYAAQRPGALVGVVTATLPEESLVAVGDVPADRYFINDPISIIDSAENTLAMGKVVRRLPESGSVHVRYISQPSARLPATGDLAIRFPR